MHQCHDVPRFLLPRLNPPTLSITRGTHSLVRILLRVRYGQTQDFEVVCSVHSSLGTDLSHFHQSLFLIWVLQNYLKPKRPLPYFSVFVFLWSDLFSGTCLFSGKQTTHCITPLYSGYSADYQMWLLHQLLARHSPAEVTNHLALVTKRCWKSPCRPEGIFSEQ